MNPKWSAFLQSKNMTPVEADALARPARISLNAEFMCWNMHNAAESITIHRYVDGKDFAKTGWVK